MGDSAVIDLMRRSPSPHNFYGRSVSPPFHQQHDTDNVHLSSNSRQQRRSRPISREPLSARNHNTSTSTHSSNLSTLLPQNEPYELSENELRVTLIRGNSGYGMNIQGGIDQPHLENDSGHFISKIRRGGAANKNGQLQVGDKIISVNGAHLQNATHEQAISHFHSSPISVDLIVQQNAEYYMKRQYYENLEKDHAKNGLSLRKVGWFFTNSAICFGFIKLLE